MVAVSERLALSLRAIGTAGEAWLAALPGLLAGLAAAWSITVGARLDGGRASYVTEARTSDGTPVVLKVSIPPRIDEFTPFDRQLAALQLAGGDPYVGLLRYDAPRRALLLQRLGRPMADLGWSASRQMAALARTAARRAGFRLVDPGGLMSEPAHDLGVIQARVVQGWLDELAASSPRLALEMVTSSCRYAGRMTGVDPEAIWHWAYPELVSTGLFVLRLGHRREAETFLAAADKLAAATAKGEPSQAPQPPTPAERPGPARLFLMVGLPGAGKTTRAKELAVAHRALRLTPDEWMICLFGESDADGKRDLLEGRLITVALQALRLGTTVVLDFGLWSRDERSALRWLATSAGASGQVIYLPIDEDVQRARIAHRQATAPHMTFPMTEADLDRWSEQFQAPDAAELGGGGEIPAPPPGWAGWPEWAVGRWPSLDPATHL